MTQLQISIHPNNALNVPMPEQKVCNSQSTFNSEIAQKEFHQLNVKITSKNKGGGTLLDINISMKLILGPLLNNILWYKSLIETNLDLANGLGALMAPYHLINHKVEGSTLCHGMCELYMYEIIKKNNIASFSSRNTESL